jgi:hypothetical protein
MGFNSAFLSPSSSPAQRERVAQEELAAERAYAARTYYKAANALIVGGMILIAIPESMIAHWFMHIIGAVAIIVTSLALLMMVKGAIWNGLLSLVFGWVILPGWFLLAPTVTRIAYEQYQVIKKEWVDKVFKK